jgi:hypothetical protein
MANSFDPKSSDTISRILRYHPQVAEAVTTVTSVLAKAKFPIASYNDFSDAMGGPQTTLQFNGRTFTLAELEQYVPSYYFPIANENDLIAKIGDLSKATPGVGTPAAVETVHGVNINPILSAATAPKPQEEAPTTPLAELHRLAGVASLEGRPVPSIGGVVR